MTEEDLLHKPNDAQFDTWLKEDFQAIVLHALDKLGLTRQELVRDPLIITGPIIWKTQGIPDSDIVSRIGHDKILRFSCHRVVVICLSETRIASFSTNLNFLRFQFVGEGTEEYLYQDIVAVRTEERSVQYNLPDGRILKSLQVFRLTVSSGDSIEVAVSSPQIRDLYGAEPAPNDYEGTVRVIREMLRDKKS